MKSIKLAVFGILASVLTLAGCTQSKAADFSLGYQNNEVINQEGVVASVGTEYKNIRLGVNTFSTDERLETYGAYVGIPIYIQGTNFTVTPQAQVDHYRELDEVVGGLGLGLEYAFTDTVRLTGVAMVHEGFDDSSIDGESYTVGLTKTF